MWGHSGRRVGRGRAGGRAKQSRAPCPALCRPAAHGPLSRLVGARSALVAGRPDNSPRSLLAAEHQLVEQTCWRTARWPDGPAHISPAESPPSTSLLSTCSTAEPTTTKRKNAIRKGETAGLSCLATADEPEPLTLLSAWSTRARRPLARGIPGAACTPAARSVSAQHQITRPPARPPARPPKPLLRTGKLCNPPPPLRRPAARHVSLSTHPSLPPAVLTLSAALPGLPPSSSGRAEDGVLGSRQHKELASGAAEQLRAAEDE
jgi:hypothetical protein